MRRKDLDRALRAVAVPDATPARDRTATVARSEASGREQTTGPARNLPRRALALACALGLSATLLLTPPGRAVTAWAGELIGVGDVGGPPTREQRDQGAPVERSVVFAAGRAPDGARYEYVVDRFPTGKDPSAPAGEGVAGPEGETFKWCLGLEFPDLVPRGISGFCGPEFPPPQRDGVVRPFGGLNAYPGVTEYLVLTGFAEPHVHRVRVTYHDENDRRREAPVDLVAANDVLRDRTGSDRPFASFVAFVDPSFPLAPGTRPFDRKAIDVIAYDANGRELDRAHPADFVNRNRGAIPDGDP